MERVTYRDDEVEPTEVVTLTTLEPLVERIRRMGEGGRRVMIGLSGAPGAGKSTLAADLVDALAPNPAVVVPLDGFHLASGVLAGTELAERRGAIDTFDGEGFGSLVTRLRADRTTLYAPRYAREIEDPIASAIVIPQQVRYLVVEGNYLLAQSSPWREARQQMDEVWYIDIDPAVRLARLVARHKEFGKSSADAHRWSHGSDEVNARMIESCRRSADLVVNVEKVGVLQTVIDGG